MTALNCRNHTTRMRVAYIADAYYAKLRKPFPTNISPDNTVSRLFTMLSDGGHPYMKMWGRIENFHKLHGWDKLCDPEIDKMYERAMSVDGLTINNTVTICIHDMASSRKRWNDSLWTRYEFKRNNRHMAGGALGKLAVLV